MNTINKKDRIYFFRYFDYNTESWVCLKSPRSTKGQEKMAFGHQRCEYGFFPKDKADLITNKVLIKGVY